MKFLLTIPGKIIGSVLCAVFFAIAGFFTGLAYPWMNHTPKPNDYRL